MPPVRRAAPVNARTQEAAQAPAVCVCSRAPPLVCFSPHLRPTIYVVCARACVGWRPPPAQAAATGRSRSAAAQSYIIIIVLT